jgi:hypothetical protein
MAEQPAPDYGDMVMIKRMLAATGTSYDANTDARLAALNTSISRLLEDVLGRTFGTAPPPEGTTRLVYGKGTSMLILPTPAWLVASVSVGGAVESDVMTGGTMLGAGAWVVGIEDPSGQISGLLHASGFWGWGEPINVTAYWADRDSDTDVPVEIVAAVNKLVVDTYKGENVPIVTDDGIVVPRRDPWADPFVARVITHYKISSRELVL